MSEIFPKDILFRVGGAVARFGVLGLAGAGRGRAAEEFKEMLIRADPRTERNLDGLIRSASANVLRVDYRDIDGDGILEPCLLAERGTTQIVENSGAETDALGWNANIANIARDNTQAIQGSWAVKVTTTNAAGSGVFVLNRSGGKFAAAASAAYSASMWVYAPPASVGKTLQLQIEWYTVGDVLIAGSQTTPVALVAGWQRLTLSTTSPATTAKALVSCYTNVIEGVFDFWVDVPQFENLAFPTSPVITSADVGGKAVGADSLSWPIAFSPPGIGKEHTYYFRGDASWPRTGALELAVNPGIFRIGSTVMNAPGIAALDVYRPQSVGQYICRCYANNALLIDGGLSLPASGPLEFLIQLRAVGTQHQPYFETAAGLTLLGTAGALAGFPWSAQTLVMNDRSVGGEPGVTWCHKLIGVRHTPTTRPTIADFRAIP